MNESKRITVSVCTLNNWALDFSGNQKRILKSFFLIILKFYEL